MKRQEKHTIMPVFTVQACSLYYKINGLSMQKQIQADFNKHRDMKENSLWDCVAYLNE